MIITIGMTHPFEEKSRNNKELANETIILLAIHFIMCFSALVPDSAAQDLVGYGFCLMMAVHCLCHLVIMMGSSILTAVRDYKRRKFLKHHKAK